MRFHLDVLLRGAGPGLALAAALSLAGGPARATTRSWSNPVSGSAGTASNWSPSGTPIYLDDVQFPASGAYTISWASPQDTVAFMHCTGTPTHSITGTLGIRNTVSAVLGELAVSLGTLRANQVLIGSQVGARLRVSGGLTGSGQVIAGSPNAPAIFADTNSTIARLYVTGGGKFLGNGWIETSRKVFASCSLKVDGYRYLLGTYYRSTIGTLTNSGGGNRGDLILGAGGGTSSHTYLDVTNGAVVDVKGTLYVGRSASTIARLYETIAGTNPRMYVLGNTLVGVDPTSAHSATGNLFVQAGTALLGGNLQIGDPDHTLGTPGFGTVWIQGGNTVVGGAIQMPAANSGKLVMTDGTLRVLSGNSEIRQDDPLNISSSIGSPNLIVNGTAYVNTYPGTSSAIALGVGRGGAGRLRVVGSAAHADAHGPVAIADSLGGTGVVEVDSAGTFASSESIQIGPGGQLSAKNGSFVTTTTSPGPIRFVSEGDVLLEDSWLISSQGVFESSGTFSGYGILYGSYENRGGFTVPAAETLEVIGGLDNRGGTISGGGTLRVEADRFQSSGTVTANVLMLNASLLPHEPLPVAMPAAARRAARLAPAGLLGTIDPPLGHLLIQGDLTIGSSAATTSIRIGSRSSGLRDTLEVTGQAILDGTLALSSLPGDAPMSGDTITVLEAAGVSGTFAAVTLDGLDPGADVEVLVDPTAVRVVFAGGTTAVGGDPAGLTAPDEIRFAPRYGRHLAALALELPAPSRVRITMYDVSGREVARLADDALAMGRHEIALPRVASGMYFARAQVDLGGRRVVKVARVALLR